MATFVDCKEFKWAVLYLVGSPSRPFTKAPIIPDTVLAAQAIVGITTDEQRFITYNGTIANNLVAQYKLFMLCGPEYMAHVNNIVDITNAFYNYLRSVVSPGLDRETAYSLCTAIFAPMTKKGVAIRALLSPYELKYIMRSNLPVAKIEPIRFQPHEEFEEDVVK